MIHHHKINDAVLKSLIKKKAICFGGNANLKIYGTLHCSSGKRMKKQNRVFFVSIDEAIANGFRPCGHCMKADYKKWKDGFVQ